MYPKELTTTPLFLHAMNTHNWSSIPQNYLIITLKVGDKILKSLVDTGAQPTVIKQSCVPIGTIINESQVCIKGVRGPKVKVLGFANIPMEIGNYLFEMECMVVKDNSINFPAGTAIIIGTNFLATNSLDVATSTWALQKQNQIVQHFEPAYIDGSLFKAAEEDYILHSSDDGIVSEVGVEDESHTRGEHSCSITKQETLTTNHTKSSAVVDRGAYKFYPQECMMQEDPDTEEVQRSHTSNTPHSVLNIVSTANVCVGSQQLSQVSIELKSSTGKTINDGLFEVNGGLVAPGVILLHGISSKKGMVTVINYTSEDVQLYKDIPFASASRIEQDDISFIQNQEMALDFKNPDVYSLMALSAITEEAFVSESEYASDPDHFQDALNYEPQNISTEEVVYNEQRFQILLELLKPETWLIFNEQRKAAIDVLKKNQRAFN